jgi:hypothetical protein
VSAGDRLLVRANDRRSGVLNGEIVTVEGIEAGVIQTADGRRIDSRRFGEFTYGYAVTSHASQSKTVAHVVVAAERLTAKAAYVACSRGRVSCAVHTPDKTALLNRLPDGNREAALDLLGADHSLARKALDRTLAWAQIGRRQGADAAGSLAQNSGSGSASEAGLSRSPLSGGACAAVQVGS